jgi:hypothetical protein
MATTSWTMWVGRAEDDLIPAVGQGEPRAHLMDGSPSPGTHPCLEAREHIPNRPLMPGQRASPQWSGSRETMLPLSVTDGDGSRTVAAELSR